MIEQRDATNGRFARFCDSVRSERCGFERLACREEKLDVLTRSVSAADAEQLGGWCWGRARRASHSADSACRRGDRPKHDRRQHVVVDGRADGGHRPAAAIRVQRVLALAAMYDHRL